MTDNSNEIPPGTVITFYSYKGGTGRTMALANLGYLLAKTPPAPGRRRVLMMDWDLEAPGLHKFFPTQCDQPENLLRPGVIEYFTLLRKILHSRPELTQASSQFDQLRQIVETEAAFDPFIVRDVVPGLDMMKAGMIGKGYPELSGQFDWYEFYENHGAVLPVVRDQLCQQYDYILIDSRTGFTDVSGICTMIFPEKLVVVFTPNNQSLAGVLDLVDRAAEYRRTSSDLRPLPIFPLPSRIDDSEHDLKKSWRAKYQNGFEEAFRRIYKDDECSLNSYFDEVQIPYKGFYAYGEKIAVELERNDTLSLHRAYRLFYHRLIDLDYAWDTGPQAEKTTETTTQATTSSPIPPTTVFPYDVYLSYHPDDKQAAVELNRLLSPHGLRVFLDVERVIPGQNHDQNLRRGLAESRALALLIGQKGPSENYALFEFERFAEVSNSSQRPIIPILLPDAKPELIPSNLKGISWVAYPSSADDQDATRRLIWGITGRRVDILPPPGRPRLSDAEAARPVPPPRPLHYRTLLNALSKGRVVFALGPGIAVSGRTAAASWIPGDPLLIPTPAELAEFLARDVNCPAEWSDNLARIAQVMALSTGEASLSDRLQEAYEPKTTTSPIHRFLAALPALFHERKWPRHQLFVTTAYDSLLERALEEACESFDVLAIDTNIDEADTLSLRNPSGEWEPLRRDLHSTGRQGEKLWKSTSFPAYDLEERLKERSIVLRIQGSLMTGKSAPRAVVTEDDFLTFVTKTPRNDSDRSPIIRKVTNSHVLFFGWSAKDWTQRALLYQLWGRERQRSYQSWAIQQGPDELDELFWSSQGVEVYHAYLDDYTQDLWNKLRASR